MIIRFAGFGGQGVVLCGYIFGKAAMLDGLNSIHTQSYGSASRGGLTRSDVGISSGEIYDLCSEELDILIVMSQQSHDAFHKMLKADGTLFYESDMVQAVPPASGRSFGISATDLAFKEFGRKIIANMLIMGFVNEIAGVVSLNALKKTILECVPPGTEATNIRALEEGIRLGKEQAMLTQMEQTR